jgi:hypothetical protein
MARSRQQYQFAAPTTPQAGSFVNFDGRPLPAPVGPRHGEHTVRTGPTSLAARRHAPGIKDEHQPVRISDQRVRKLGRDLDSAATEPRVRA